jgi:hypothetical protein
LITDQDLSNGDTIACLPFKEVDTVAKAAYYASKTLKKILARVPD